MSLLECVRVYKMTVLNSAKGQFTKKLICGINAIYLIMLTEHHCSTSKTIAMIPFHINI